MSQTAHRKDLLGDKGFDASYFAERKAHAPLPARAHVDHGEGVVITGNHRNRAAGRGCHVAACSDFGFYRVFMALRSISLFMFRSAIEKLGSIDSERLKQFSASSLRPNALSAVPLLFHVL